MNFLSYFLLFISFSEISSKSIRVRRDLIGQNRLGNNLFAFRAGQGMSGRLKGKTFGFQIIEHLSKTRQNEKWNQLKPIFHQAVKTKSLKNLKKNLKILNNARLRHFRSHQKRNRPKRF